MEWLGSLKTRGVSPSPRKGHTMTRLLDSPIVLVYGGEGPGHVFLDDMHALNLDTNHWMRIEYAPGPRPAARLLHTATAVSQTKMLLFGGDITPPPDDKHHTSGPSNDAWLFDIKTYSWTRLPNSPQTPAPRAAHTAVLCRFLGHPPAVYVFGGFNNEARPAAIVFRLRLSDWKWEQLPVLVARPDGAEMVTTDPATALLNLRGDDRVALLHPGPRESHAAVWLPSLDAMAVLTGEENDMTADCWLFAPAPPSRPNAPSPSRLPLWTWCHRALSLAHGALADAIPPSSGVAAITLPTDGKRTRILLWGGINADERVNDIGSAHVVDLADGRSRGVRLTGKKPRCGGLLFGHVRHDNHVLFHDGCDLNGEITPGIEYARLAPDLGVMDSGPATYFGADAARFAHNGKPPASNAKPADRVPLVGPSTSVQVGAKGDVRIIKVDEHGLVASIVLGGKIYKGLLLKDPLGDASAEIAATAGGTDAAPTAASGGSTGAGTEVGKKHGTGTRPPATAVRTAPQISAPVASSAPASTAAAKSNGAVEQMKDKGEEEERIRAERARQVRQAFAAELPDEIDELPQAPKRPKPTPHEIIDLDCD